MAERPLPEYAVISGAFGAVLGGFLLISRGRVPERIGLGDIVRVGAASYKLGRLVAKDEVTSWVRAPVTQDEDATKPKQQGSSGRSASSSRVLTASGSGSRRGSRTRSSSFRGRRVSSRPSSPARPSPTS